jgi:hypothetical protein
MFTASFDWRPQQGRRGEDHVRGRAQGARELDVTDEEAESDILARS